MIRLVFILLCIALGAFALVRLVIAARKGRIDWPGVAFAVGFVILALWLRSVTEMGGVFG